MKIAYAALALITLTFFACKKKDLHTLPALTTTAVSNITDSTAMGGGTFTRTGNVSISVYGVEWSTSAAFAYGNWDTIGGSATGSFTSNLTGLFSGTTYYIRAYAVIAIDDTVYGNALQFTTPYIPGKYTVTTVAGTGTAGATNGNSMVATFTNPDGITVDASGNLYVADGSGAIRVISVNNNMVSTLATFSATAGSNAPPSDVAIDATGNVYAALPVGNEILKISPAGTVSVFNPGINQPVTMDIDASGNLYVGSGAGFEKITPAGIVNTIPTSITPTFAICVDNSGDIYESNILSIDMVNPGGVISFVAGGTQKGMQDGTGSTAVFGLIDEMKVGPDGNIYVADGYNNRIRMVTPAGVVTTIAGTGATGATDGNSGMASFNFPSGLAIDKSGNIYVADVGNNKIRKISPL
jgi:NHL repeat